MARSGGEADDPLGEEHDSPVPGLVHRYPDRVLLLVLDSCSSYCRYCTRSRVVGQGEIVPSEERLERALDYIRRTPAIRDVLLSGGDPLLLERPAAGLDSDASCGPSRTSSSSAWAPRCPPCCRSASPGNLCRMLRKHHPLWMSLHFIHPDECTPGDLPGLHAAGRRRHSPGLADGAAARASTTTSRR